MKRITAKLAGVLGASFIASTAAGANPNAMTISAASFDDQTPSTAQCVARWNGGISNLCSWEPWFMYGIPKGPSAAGYTVTVEGSHNTTGLYTDYAVFSFSHDGNFLLYQQGSASNNGKWSKSVSFTSTQAPASGRLTMFLGLPPNQQGSVYGITVAY